MFKSCIILSKKEGLNPDKCRKPQKTCSTSIRCATTPDRVKIKTLSCALVLFLVHFALIKFHKTSIPYLLCSSSHNNVAFSLCPFLPWCCDTIFSGTLYTLNNLRSFQSQKLSCSELQSRQNEKKTIIISHAAVLRRCTLWTHLAPASSATVALGWSTVNPRLCWQAARYEGAPLLEGKAEQGDKR